MQLENLPKILTARLNGRGPMGWEASMGVDPLVAEVEQAKGLEGLNAAYQLHGHLVDEANDTLAEGEPRLGPVAKIPFFRAALVSVRDGAWLGGRHYDTVSEWAEATFVPPTVTATVDATGLEWDDYIDWERLGEDAMDAMVFARRIDAVYRIGDDDLVGPFWVFDRAKVRACLGAEVRRVFNESEGA